MDLNPKKDYWVVTSFVLNVNWIRYECVRNTSVSATVYEINLVNKGKMISPRSLKYP